MHLRLGVSTDDKARVIPVTQSDLLSPTLPPQLTARAELLIFEGHAKFANVLLFDPSATCVVEDSYPSPLQLLQRRESYKGFSKNRGRSVFSYMF